MQEMPWEKRRRARQQVADPYSSDPYASDPYTISGPERQPPPQTAAQSTRDQQQVSAGVYDPARAAAALEAERLRIQKENLELQRMQAQGPAGPGTEGERKAAAFLTRAIGANRGYEETGIGPRSLIGQSLADTMPYALNSLPSSIGNSQDRQVSDTAQDEFIAATLRQDSGAAIPPEEMQSQRRIYFPMPGDGPDVIEQKRLARLRAIAGLVESSGTQMSPELQEIVGEMRSDLRQAVTGQGGGMPNKTASGMDASAPILRTDATRGRDIEINDGSTGVETREDPRAAAYRAHIGKLFAGGASDGEIVRFFQQERIPLGNLRELLKWRKTRGFREWQRQNPGEAFPVLLHKADIQRPMSAVERAGAALASSAPGAAVGSYLNTVSGNHLDNLAEVTGGNGDIFNEQMRQLRQQHPYASLAGDVAAGASLYGAGRKIGTKVAAKIAPKLRALAGDAALGGYIGSGAAGTDVVNLKSTAGGAALSAGAGALLRGGARALSPTGGQLAPVYREGVQPSMGQRMGGVVNRAEQAFTSVPILGGIQRSSRNKAVDQAQRGAFNQALREIGEELPENIRKGTGAHAYMQRAFNRVYDRARSAMTFRPDGKWSQDIGAIQQEVALLQPSSQQVFAAMVKPIGVRLQGRGGVLTGDDYKTMASRIGAKVRALRKNPNGDNELAEALEKLSVALDDGARRHSPPEAAALLDAADRGYVKSVIIENAARGAGEAGEFSGAALENAIKNGAGGLRSRAFLRGEAPMQDYAAAMKQLGPTVADSGTGERIMTMGGMGSMAHFIDPLMLTPYAANTAANLPGVRNAVNAALAPNRPGLAPIRDQIMNRPHLPGLFSVPFIQSQFGP